MRSVIFSVQFSVIHLSSLESSKTKKSKELIKINKELQKIDKKLKEALEVREQRVINKMVGGGKENSHLI